MCGNVKLKRKEMIAIAGLLIFIQDRLTDADTLLTARRYDNAVYLGRYAVEIALKTEFAKR